MTIRKMKRNEYPIFYKELIEYGSLQYKKCYYFLSNKRSKYVFKKVVNYALDKGYNTKNNMFYSVEHNNKYCGHLWLKKTPDKDVLLLASIYLNKKYRNKGWGNIMMKYTEKICKEMKMNKILLNVFHHNENAVDLYKKNKYYITEMNMMKNI